MDPSAVWRDQDHRWRIEAYRAPDLRFAIYATNGTTESLPVVTENVVNGQKTLVTLQQRRIYSPTREGFGGILSRMVLHLSIGEAY